tara:strand:+ start:613 stop:780 length:168 start_codon:yes stop_codon:yes gene_type:complete
MNKNEFIEKVFETRPHSISEAEVKYPTVRIKTHVFSETIEEIQESVQKYINKIIH